MSNFKRLALAIVSVFVVFAAGFLTGSRFPSSENPLSETNLNLVNSEGSDDDLYSRILKDRERDAQEDAVLERDTLMYERQRLERALEDQRLEAERVRDENYRLEKERINREIQDAVDALGQ